jgi:hypothetical protein
MLGASTGLPIQFPSFGKSIMDKKNSRRSPVVPALPPGIEAAEEILVADDRAGLTPSQLVEQKLVRLLKRNPLPVSQMNSGRHLIRAR